MNLAGYVIFANLADALEADAWSWNPCDEIPGENSR